MSIILIFILLNLSLSEDCGNTSYIYDTAEYNEIEVSENDISFDNIDCITTDLAYIIILQNSYENVYSYENIIPLRLFQYQPIRAPPVLS